MKTKDAYYFSHDSNARNDEKMLQLRAVYKSEGYGWYWILIEMMRDANGYMLQYDARYSFAAIAKELDCPEETARQFVDDCINEFQLFKLSAGHFYSESLHRRLERIDHKRKQARDAINKRWQRAGQAEQSNETDTDVLHEYNDSNTSVILLNKSKVKEKKENTPPNPLTGEMGAGILHEEGEIPGRQRDNPGGQKEPPEWTADFLKFWEAYGKKVDRSKCERKFKNLSTAERVKLLAHVPKYVASTPDVQYRKNPLTYLNGKCWEDEDLPAQGETTTFTKPKIWV